MLPGGRQELRKPLPELQGSQQGNLHPWAGKKGAQVGLRPCTEELDEAGQCTLGVVSKRKEDLGSHWISTLTVLGGCGVCVGTVYTCSNCDVFVCSCMCVCRIVPLLNYSESV